MATKPSNMPTAEPAKDIAERISERTKPQRMPTLRKASLLTIGMLTACASVMGAVAQATTSTPVEVTVDYAADAGPANHVGSGFLHGLTAEGPPDYLVDGVDVNTIRGADHHPILPSLFDPATYKRVASTGAELQVGVYYYKDLPGHPQFGWRPGDNGDWETWRGIVTDVYEEAKQSGYEVGSYITWNEPNLQWNTAERPFDRYLMAHDVAHDTLKGLDPAARVQGPELSSFNFDRLTQFLAYCKANDCLPDVLSWHELGQTPTDIPGHLSQIREWMVANGIEPMPVSIDEYQGSGYGNPSAWNVGRNVRWIAQLERATEFGLESANLASWEWPGEDPNFKATLSNAVDRATGALPRGVWWNLNAYKDMTGRMVETVSPGPPFAGPDQILQAEDAGSSGAVVANNWSGYTGRGFWNPQHASGDWAEWNVDVAEAGKYSLIFRYANGSTANRPLDVSVNGAVAAQPAFAPTGGWSNWKYETVVVDLPAGASTVRIANVGARGPNVDYLGISAGAVTPSDDPAPVDAFSSVDTELRRSVTLIGNQTTSTKEVSLKLANIPGALINGNSVHLRATAIANAETLTAPAVVLDDKVEVVDGTATVTLQLPAESSLRIDVTPEWNEEDVQRVEFERLHGVTTQNAGIKRVLDHTASGHAAIALNTSDTGEGVTYEMQVKQDGVYRLELGGQRSDHNGLVQLYVDGAAVGGPVDQFGAEEQYFGSGGGVMQLDKGKHEIRLVAVGQNPGSAGSDVVVDYLDLQHIGD